MFKNKGYKNPDECYKIWSYRTFRVALLALFKLSSKNSSDDNARSLMSPWDFFPSAACTGQQGKSFHLFIFFPKVGEKALNTLFKHMKDCTVSLVNRQSLCRLVLQHQLLLVKCWDFFYSKLEQLLAVRAPECRALTRRFPSLQVQWILGNAIPITFKNLK